MRLLAGVLISGFLYFGCATTGTDGTSQLAAAEPAQDDELQNGKQSLNKMLDENEKVTLVDDDTGDTRLVCRRIKPRTGTRLGSRKLCATEKQWRDREVLAKDEVDEVQRSMNAKCPTCN